ncbi:MAG: hypothetical protein PVF70_08090 [Anaerolineales bacterium]
MTESLAGDQSHLAEHIQQAISEGRYETGVYAVPDLLFEPLTPEVTQILP